MMDKVFFFLWISTSCFKTCSDSVFVFPGALSIQSFDFCFTFMQLSSFKQNSVTVLKCINFSDFKMDVDDGFEHKFSLTCSCIYIQSHFSRRSNCVACLHSYLKAIKKRNLLKPICLTLHSPQMLG